MWTEPVRVDAHHHVWDLSVRDQDWTADLPALRRNFLVDDLVPDLRAHDIVGTVLVQTIAVPAETPELLVMADAHSEILGVVGWVDLAAPDVPERLDELREGPGGAQLVGIRHQVQGESDPRWLLRYDVRRGLEAVADAGLAYDLLVTHEQLSAAVEVVPTVPAMRWVLDHAGKPPVAAGELDPWREDLSRLADEPSVACKLSGLVTEAGSDWSYDGIAPYAEHVLTSFGADRVMFGSDWPVCLLRATYDEVVVMSERFIDGLSASEQVDVWGGTAVRWYSLTDGSP